MVSKEAGERGVSEQGGKVGTELVLRSVLRVQKRVNLHSAHRIRACSPCSRSAELTAEACPLPLCLFGEEFVSIASDGGKLPSGLPKELFWVSSWALALGNSRDNHP